MPAEQVHANLNRWSVNTTGQHAPAAALGALPPALLPLAEPAAADRHILIRNG
jgi:hypothetical protein